ncbi:MAG: hypothetical protein GEU73_11325 [Chloroflexi bacterium]|nr:hypothetical protein [Chloroflexota bacterium]
MDQGVQLYAGTQEGLFVFRSDGAHWQEASVAFRDGIIDSIAGALTHPERVFVGLTHEGLYRTQDGGVHWDKVLEGDIRSVAIDPTDENVVYTGTEPVHLYRSEDRGTTWGELSSLQEMPEDVRKHWWFPRPPHQGHVRNIFIHPDDPNVIYLCLEHGGIVRSYDRGTTWEDVTEGIEYRDIHVISSLPHHFDRYYVATARGFFATDEPASGWTRAENGFTRDYFHDFLFLPPKRQGENPTMLIATADQSPGYWDRPGLAQSAVFRSHDCAQSWHRVGEGIPDCLEPMVWALAHHPHDEDAVFAGLGNVSRGHAAGGGGQGVIMVTRDRGDSWQPLDVELPADRVLLATAE